MWPVGIVPNNPELRRVGRAPRGGVGVWGETVRNGLKEAHRVLARELRLAEWAPCEVLAHTLRRAVHPAWSDRLARSPLAGHGPASGG